MNELIPFLAIVLLAAEAGGFLAHVLGMPRVVGQIGAGLVLGPSLLGIVPIAGPMEGVAQLGALAILGIAGLETNMAAMREVGRPAFYAAVGGVVMPFVAGLAIALSFGLTLTSALFIGAILTATSVGITAATLRELGLFRGRAAVTILGAAIIDDVLGLIVLGAVVAESGSGPNVLLTVVPMTVTILVAWMALRWLPSHLGRVVEMLHVRGGGEAATLGLVLGVAWVVQTWGGLAGITGAYVAGLALAGTPIAPKLRDGLLRTGEAFCVPVFFVAIGLAVDLRTVGPVLPLTAALLAVAVAGKFVGSGLGAAAGGLDARESSLVGIGMVARGEVALVAASVGLHAGAIGAPIYAAVVLVSLATTIIAPLGISAWSWIGRRASWPKLDLDSGPAVGALVRLDVE